jgi:hypothetical protein
MECEEETKVFLLVAVKQSYGKAFILETEDIETYDLDLFIPCRWGD